MLESIKEAIRKIASLMNKYMRRLANMISVCILHKDDMCNLIRSVASVDCIAEEILIIDSGECDYSYLAEMHPKIRIIKYQNSKFSFAKAKNLGVKEARNEWIMFLDSDEELVVGQEEKIASMVMNPSTEAYSCIITNFFSDGTWSSFPVTRLFKRLDGILYEKDIHETVNYAFMKKGIIPRIVNINIAHYGYLISNEKIQEKQKKYIALLREQLSVTPLDAASIWHMAMSYKIIDDNTSAYKYIDRAIQIEKNNKIPRIFKARFLLCDKKYIEAFKELMEAQEIDEALYWNPTIHNLRGMVLLELGEYREAKTEFQKAHEGQPWSIAVLVNMSITCRLLNEGREGMQFLEKAIEEVPLLLGNHNMFNRQINVMQVQQDVTDIFRKDYNSNLEELYRTLKNLC